VLNRGPQRVHDLRITFGQLDEISFCMKWTYGAQILALVVALLAGVVSDVAFVIGNFINEEIQHTVEDAILLWVGTLSCDR